MAIFKSDIEKFFAIEEWEIQIDWCLGEREARRITCQLMTRRNPSEPMKITNSHASVEIAAAIKTVPVRPISL